ncbi:hypothetical protein SARC_01418 [Sphaeroforma arctica JP610]|uniref:F-box domain-containing protein n=1 Tax=Sphaeroforma arctica JP610 TaxID=667725 RepID=A0A0L0GBR8_9EUKA|nr:hypothetical protein SARC_01418 [Sphaeroforma arctica JP610]KNC86462.1 hypothetical protein SARC_01418 [Sphaeroforma arctica JP610]|eukprot:XP_014160364.1 hypothetical protein SARC_01418 [Sphaeroforma arctica JP610]
MAQETLLQCRTESNHTVGKRCAGSVAKYRSVTPILNLPFEILEKICGFITDTDDLIELIHTCRRLCVVLKPDGKHWTLMIKRMWGNALPRWFIPSKVIKPGWTHSTQRGLSVVFEKVVQHECFEFFDYSIKVFRSLCKQLCYNSLYQLCRDWTMNSCYVCLHDERCLAPGKVLLKREITGKKRQLMLCVPHARATIPLGTIRDKYGLKPVDVDHLQDASIPQRSRRLQQPCYFTDNVLNRCIEVYGNLSVCGHTKVGEKK